MTGPGFYPDPDGSRRMRYWDGRNWTDQLGGPVPGGVGRPTIIAGSIAAVVGVCIAWSALVGGCSDGAEKSAPVSINGIDYRKISGIVNRMSIPAEFNANTNTSPVGVTGKQRESYLALDTGQRRIYRYNYDVCGRLAAHCYQIAVGA